MKSATPAAEPWDDPPGVRAGSCGLVVGPGWVPANSAVTVLPRMTRARLAQDRHRRRVRRRAVPRIDRRAHLRRHVGGIEDVLDPDRHAVERPGRRRRFVAGAGPGEREVGVQKGPCPDRLLALGDAREAGAHRRLRRRPAFGDGARRLGGAGRVEPADHLSRSMSISGFCWPPSISIIVPLTKCASGEAR